MKKKLIIVGSIILGVIILGLILFFLLKDNNSGIKPSQFELIDVVKISMCKEGKQCPISNPSVFGNISFDTDITELKDAIADMNDETQKYKDKVLKSNFSSSFISFPKTYSSIILFTILIIYQTKKIVHKN